MNSEGFLLACLFLLRSVAYGYSNMTIKDLYHCALLLAKLFMPKFLLGEFMYQPEMSCTSTRDSFSCLGF